MLDWYKEINNFSKTIEDNFDTLKNIWSGSVSLQNVHTDSKQRSNAKIIRLMQKNNLYSAMPLNEKKYQYPLTGDIILDDNGFRVYNSDSHDKKVLCFGCSNTFGIGISDINTWPYKLGECLNASPFNYGINGTSIDRITWTIYNSLTECNRNNSLPDSFYVLFPDIFRCEYFNESEEKDNRCNRLIFSYGSDINFEFYSEFNKLLDKPLLSAIRNNIHHVHFSQLTIMNCMLSFMKNFKFIETIASLYNVKWFWSTWDPVFLGLKPQTIYDLFNCNTFITDKNNETSIKMFKDKASDNIHISETQCDFIAKQFASLRNAY